MFSIVTPVWNKAHTLRRTVEHALAQGFADFELILIDDGSTDESLDTLGGIADPRLRIVSQTNAGPGAARNRGIAEARHEWIAFLDADDLWHPDHLAELDRIRTRHPEAALIGTAFVDSDRRGRFAWPAGIEGRIEPVSYVEAIGAGDSLFFTSSAAARTDALRALGGFGPFPRGEDTELWVRLDLAHPVARSTRATAVYMHGTGGITETLGAPWPGAIPGRPQDLSPAVATALAARSAAAPRLRAAIDAFVDRYVQWMVDGCAARGDGEAVRAILRFHSRPAPLPLRLKALPALLPQPLGGVGLRLASVAGRALAALSRRAAGSSATGRGRAGRTASPPAA